MPGFPDVVVAHGYTLRVGAENAVCLAMALARAEALGYIFVCCDLGVLCEGAAC